MPDKIRDTSPEQNPHISDSKTEETTLTAAEHSYTDNTDTAGETINLPDMTSKLKSLEESVSTTPEINQANVNRIREKIARGSFKIDPGKIANKMMKFEDDL